MAPEVTFVLGTRPEIIKLSPVIHQCERRSVPYSIVHTGQHYSESLDDVFFEQLELPEPDYNLEVGSGSHGHQTAEMIAGVEEILLEDDPAVVLVQGDTNSVLAGAVATAKLDVEIGHVEAGLRSFDREMPEEINRVLADHASDYLFAPTEQSREYLRTEGLPADRITVTGNTIVDALHRNQQLAAEKSDVLARQGLDEAEYFLMTAHRAENVDDPERFRNLLQGAGTVASTNDVEVVYPIHPRARQRLQEFDLDVPDPIRLLEPQDYLDFLLLEVHADLILTDSGGVQEEACVLQVPCVTMRDNTERPETVEVGANCLSGTSPDAIRQSVTNMLDTEPTWDNPFGDGQAADRIIETVATDTVSATAGQRQR